ncbi:MAG: peptide MFS transporter [Gammaproteobacteria bacterium]|nr:peptide MFS transporter [Gammaproteobacteria bacterium]
MNVAATAEPRDLLGHPRGLAVLFFAEMWERFSFYGMRALLIFYLTQHFLFDDAMSAGIYATYGAMVYLMPVIGGMVADRYLGFRKAVIVGAVLLCFGHLGMAFEGDPARTVDGVVIRDEVSLQVLYLSLAFIVIGVGFLKSSISNMVGELYGPDDNRRDGGFTLFYMGINLGAFVAGIVCGYLGQTYGWRYGFGLAGIGMLAGLVTFVRGRRLLLGAGEPPDRADLGRALVGRITREQLIWGAALVAVLVMWQILQHQEVVGGMLLLGGGAVVIGLIWFSLARCTPVERDRTLVVLGLTSVSVVFWALFEQAGSSMSLFADRNVDREIAGMTPQASQFQSLNPLFIIFLAPLFAGLWPMLARRGFEPGTPAKFGLAIVQVGLGFAALVYGCSVAGENHLVAAGWLAFAYVLHTTGELCLSPVGLSMVTQLSVARIAGMMMGVWFRSAAFSSYVAGIIAAGASVDTSNGLDRAASLAIYADTFEYLTIVALAVGVAMLAVAPWVRRRMHEGVTGDGSA